METSASTTAIVSLNNTPPVVAISSFEDGDQYPLDRTTLLVLEGEVSDTEHALEELEFEWRVFFHHNDHFHPEPVEREKSAFTLISPLGCAGEDYWYRIELTVTDPAGLTSTDSRQIFPFCGTPFVAFTDLEAKAEENHVQLDWKTNQEEKVMLFEIQRSTDFFNFEKIGEMEPKGINQLYTFKDENPIRGNNIYRIKVIEETRAYNYSNFVTVTYPEAPPIRIYPNPAGNSFEVELKEN